MEKIVEVKNLSFSYSEQKSILDKTTFSINKGSIFGLVGKNGAGKTTLIQIILGLFKPDAGSITVAGYNFSEFQGG